VNFYYFAEYFKSIKHCKNALYLDGVVSEAYNAKLKKKNTTSGDFGVMIGIFSN
jgi:uncharacterized protein YigE (DUF2233 family)